MEVVLYKIPIKSDAINYSDFVTRAMKHLKAKYPEIQGYQWEKIDDGIQILMWGAIDT